MEPLRSVEANRLAKLEKMLTKIRRIVGCGICLEPVTSPAAQCEEGHLVCPECQKKMSETHCPTCRGPMSKVRNRIAEQVVETLLSSCENALMGCRELLEVGEEAAHSVVCPMRTYNCPLDPLCTWKGYKPEISVHTNQHHPHSIITSSQQIIRLSLEWDRQYLWTYFHAEEVLIVSFYLDRPKNALLGTVQCLGMVEPIDDLRYKISLKYQDNEVTLAKNVQKESEFWTSINDLRSVMCFPGDLLKNDCTESERRGTWDQIEARLTVEDARSESGASKPIVADKSSNDKHPTTMRKVIFEVAEWLRDIAPLAMYSSELKETWPEINEALSEIEKVVVRGTASIERSLREGRYETRTLLTIGHLSAMWGTLGKGNLDDVVNELFKRRADEGGTRAVIWQTAVRMVVCKVVWVVGYVAFGTLSALCSEAEAKRVRDACHVTDKLACAHTALRLLAMAHTGGGAPQVERTLRFIAKYAKDPPSNELVSRIVRDAITVKWSTRIKRSSLYDSTFSIA